MASKRLKGGSNAVLYSVLALGILILANIIASQKFYRLDLTAEKIFTISPASKKLVASLPDRLTVKAFISSDLPPQVQNVARYLRDMLNEYATYSNGKMVWEVLDPSKDDKIKDEARRLKVQQARLSVFEKSKASVSESFLGVAFQYGGKVESLPFVTDIANLEYQISSTIRQLTGKKRKIGFSTGHGEPSFSRGLQNAQKALREHEVVTVDLSEGKKPIPDDVDVLVVVGPTQPLAERAKYELDQFLMKGKALALLLDGMVLETPRGQTMPGQMPPRVGRTNTIGLRDQLKYYGVDLGDDLLLDGQNARVMLPAGQGQRVIVNYPAFPIVTELSRESPITREVKAFVPIFPSSLSLVNQDKLKEVKATLLASTSGGSWRHTGFFVFDPLHPPKPTNEKGPFHLAYELQGSFNSFFAGKPAPPPGPAAPTPPTNVPQPKADGPHSPPSARLLVVGDSDFIKDQFLGIYPQNLMLLQNMIDFLAQDESLISIRAKSQTHRPLEQVEDSTISLVKWGNIVGLPAVFVLLGFVRWRWRIAARRRRAARLLADSGTSR